MADSDLHLEQCEVAFAQALTQLKSESGMSFRELALALGESGSAMSPSHLSALANGFARPSLRTMRRLAAVFGRPPTYFAEFRLAQLRSLLDEGYDAGLDGALSVVCQLPTEVRLAALERDPEDAPNAVPYRSGPTARDRAS